MPPFIRNFCLFTDERIGLLVESLQLYVDNISGKEIKFLELVSGSEDMEDLQRKRAFISQSYVRSSVKTAHLQTIFEIELKCRHRCKTAVRYVI